MTGSSGAHERSGLPDPMDWEALTPARQRAGLSMAELYLRYVALGGSVSKGLLSQHFSTGVEVTVGEHDLAVLALNERFLEMNVGERLPYAR